MPVKYHCAKCGRRFVDWGAEKLGFKCPDCGDQELVRIGVSDDRPSRRASLKRGSRKAVVAAPVELDDELAAADGVPLEVDEEAVVDEEVEEPVTAFVVVDEEEGADFVRNPAELITSDADEDEVDLDMPEDLTFGEVAPPIVDDAFEEPDEDPWHA